MGRIEMACMAIGAGLMIAGVAVVFWPAALFVAGALLFLVGWPKVDG